MQLNTPTHPSRSAKLCKDCKHFEPNRPGNDGRLRFPRCEHPAVPVDLVYGIPKWTAEDSRRGINALDNCGQDAAWFERAPSAGCKTCGGRGELSKLVRNPDRTAVSPCVRQTENCPDCRTEPMATAIATMASGDTGPANSC